MTDYTITEAEHQTLTDFLRAVQKGSLSKKRMAELAAVHLDDLTIKESEAGPEPKAEGEPMAPYYPDRLVITFKEKDGTARVIAWYPEGPDGKSGYRSDPSARDPYELLRQAYDQLIDKMAEVIDDQAQNTNRVDVILSELQRIVGLKVSMNLVLNMLRETQECVQALMALPAKTGTVQALRRVMALRRGLQDSIEYIKSVSGYLELLGGELDDLGVDDLLDGHTIESIKSYEDQADTLLSTLKELADPTSAESDP
jgi:hypothetical protein